MYGGLAKHLPSVHTDAEVVHNQISSLVTAQA